jgi:predicted DNA-binding ribbon-helix-helix protein
MSQRDEEASSVPVRSFVVAGRRTSVRLDPIVWDALHDVAARQQRSLTNIVTEIDAERGARSLTTALHVYIVQYYQLALIDVEGLALKRRHG